MLYDWPSFWEFFKTDFNWLKRFSETRDEKRKFFNNKRVSKWVSLTRKCSKKYFNDRGWIERTGARFVKINEFWINSWAL